ELLLEAADPGVGVAVGDVLDPAVEVVLPHPEGEELADRAPVRGAGGAGRRGSARSAPLAAEQVVPPVAVKRDKERGACLVAVEARPGEREAQAPGRMRLGAADEPLEPGQRRDDEPLGLAEGAKLGHELRER